MSEFRENPERRYSEARDYEDEYAPQPTEPTDRAETPAGEGDEARIEAPRTADDEYAPQPWSGDSASERPEPPRSTDAKGTTPGDQSDDEYAPQPWTGEAPPESTEVRETPQAKGHADAPPESPRDGGDGPPANGEFRGNDRRVHEAEHLAPTGDFGDGFGRRSTDDAQSPAENSRSGDHAARTREAVDAARSARLEQAAGLPPEHRDPPGFQYADRDNQQAIRDSIDRGQADQGDLIRTDPAISEATTEALKVAGDALSRSDNDNAKLFGETLKGSGFVLEMMRESDGGRVGEALSEGIDRVAERLGVQDNPSVTAVTDQLKDRIKTIVDARYPGREERVDEHRQPPLIS